MKFGVICEADNPKGMSQAQRLNEVIDEACLADKLGFDFWGTSEQHCSDIITAPEVLYGAVAVKTSRIKIRHMAILMLPMNHPVRIAERLATLDIISGGRVELCTARSNNPVMLGAFGINPADTRRMWRETLEATVRALVEHPFDYSGEFYNITSATVYPKLTRDMFPVSVIGTSDDTFELAAASGLGVMGHDSYLGWDKVAEIAGRYRNYGGLPKPFAPYPVSNTLSYCVFTANCDVREDLAIEKAGHVARGFFNSTANFYRELSKKSEESYGDMKHIEKMANKIDDLPYIMDHTPSIIIGTPDRFINAVEKLQSLGYDEVIFRVDGFGHEQNMRAISLIAKYVIPHFRNPQSVHIRPPQRPYADSPDFLI